MRVWVMPLLGDLERRKTSKSGRIALQFKALQVKSRSTRGVNPAYCGLGNETRATALRRPWRALVSAQQREHLLRQLVGLRDHRGAGLLQHLGTRQVGGFHREVGILNAAARS